MVDRVPISRVARVPDELAVARYRRAPELGPRVLFFSGGSALRPLSRMLKRFTHNSRHLITAFDSGGSSAHLRRAFGMLSIGDLRNRLLALADETQRGNPAIYRLFSHRLSKVAPPLALRRTLDGMVIGGDPLVAAVPTPLARLIRTHLRHCREAMPPAFDLRGASVGNLVLAGAYLSNDRDVASVVFPFSQLVEVRGLVCPIVEADLHLAAELESGERIVGQHRLTGKDTAPITSSVRNLELVTDLETGTPTEIEITEDVRELITGADLICYPMGSFFSSIVSNLLPRGVGRAIAQSACPKVFVPNTGVDPEQIGRSAASCAETLVEYVRRDTGEETPVDRIIDIAVLDATDVPYAEPPDAARLAELGPHVIRPALRSSPGDTRLDPERLTALLLSLA